MPCLNGTPVAVSVDLLFVQLSVPEDGVGSKLDAMAQFVLERGEELRIGCFRGEVDRRQCAVFAFRDARNATDFANRFSGEILIVPSNDDLSFP
jgi:hypothetical protein